MRHERWLSRISPRSRSAAALTLAIALLLSACTLRSPAASPPTCVPAGYAYIDYEDEGTAGSQQGIALTKAIWGKYQLRFLGVSGLSDGTRLVTSLRKDSARVDWWPEGSPVFVDDDRWEVKVKAGEFGLPGEFPPPDPGYSLQVSDIGSAPLADFRLEFPPPSTGTPPPNATPSGVLAGTEWGLVSLDGHRLVPFTRINLRFGQDGAGGSSGCNGYGGGYVVTSGGHFSLYGITSTQLSCNLPFVNRQAEEYLNRLGDAACYRLVDNRLELYDIITNERTLVFEKRAN